ncbi:hypothetical protein WH52_05495 [Tenacibaculum holothuriorum]|uniref:HTH araC/xylS-type domain-containing protein n=1 Tax=Tenacibaculum holothuriorum TaxID=1635173 RepID=A0A1Y2PFT1_9FLAO|nr:helix-turn-helix domain-containing protein [Tenacibaculum holothuriorum]OSY88579.1 hypothetical protein WH52_05495 [Tenacibaculum holothuriorum]
MNFENPILFFICSLGVFNGFLVAIYFLLFNKQKRIPNFLFGLLVLFLSIRIGKSVYRIFMPKEMIDITIMQIGLSACFLIGISLFYYLKSSIENKQQIPKSWKLHFLMLFLIIITVGIVKPYKSNYEFWGTFIWVIYSTWGLYLIASAFILKDIFYKLFSKVEKCTTAEYWLLAVLIGNILIYIAYIIGYYYLYFIGTITFSLVFYGLLFFFLSKNNRETIFRDIPQKYAAKKIEDTEATELIDKLRILIEKDELYKNSDIKLQKVAKELQLTSHKLSQLLNDNLGKSFSVFINDYRVEEAKKLLKESDKLTLEAIGYEAGFSSKSNFYATFKKVVGKTPSEYKSQF